MVAVGSDGSEVPAIYIDSVRAKVGLAEPYSRTSNGSLNLVVQQGLPPGLLPPTRFGIPAPFALSE